MIYFPTRLRLYVKVRGENPKRIKSFNLEYLKRVKEDYRARYSPEEVEFSWVASVVKICPDPKKKFTVDYNWAKIWGKNSDGDYYVASEDFARVKKLTEIKPI